MTFYKFLNPTSSGGGFFCFQYIYLIWKYKTMQYYGLGDE